MNTEQREDEDVDPEEIARLRKEYEEAYEEELDAASRAATAAAELRGYGIEVER